MYFNFSCFVKLNVYLKFICFVKLDVYFSVICIVNPYLMADCILSKIIYYHIYTSLFIFYTTLPSSLWFSFFFFLIYLIWEALVMERKISEKVVLEMASLCMCTSLASGWLGGFYSYSIFKSLSIKIRAQRIWTF